jgi:hypothetical protein
MKRRKGFLQAPTSQTSTARTADPKPDLNERQEVYVEFAFKETMNLNADKQCF